MKIIDFLKEQGLEALKQQYSIVVKEYPNEGLYVLNYDQINSPKCDLTSECRGLILDKDFNVVSRSFDRFFNLGEMPQTQTHIDITKCVAHEKLDGSLIKIYYWNGEWRISTRGTAFAESEVMGFPITFQELVLSALRIGSSEFTSNDLQKELGGELNEKYTYIFEITSPQNRCVVRYPEAKLYFLAARNNKTGELFSEGIQTATFEWYNIGVPKKFKFETTQDCIEATKNLPNLEEGYVLYQDNIPVCKVKNPAYLTCHRIKGEGLSIGRIVDLVILQDHEEYLAYFDEDRSSFEPYIQAYDKMKIEIQDNWINFKNIEGQKEFALAIKELPYKSVYFDARKRNFDPWTAFCAMRESAKGDILKTFV